MIEIFVISYSNLTLGLNLIIFTALSDQFLNELYYEFKEPLKRIVPHRILAINRAEKEGILKVHIDIEQSQIFSKMQKLFIQRESIFRSLIEQSIEDSYKRLIAPSIERELRNELTDAAEQHAIKVFATNLRQLLLQPPVKGKRIMGIDPGFRTGCKVAIIDETGKYLEGDTIYPHPPQNQVFESKTCLRRLIEKHHVDLVAIGNGTASRETETLITELIGDLKQAGEKEIYYIIINEAGASVYSASKIAQKEFPDLDASMRGNISIARRLLDPLAELVKIDPKSIGVGLYQHDINQKKLAESLHEVVESAVNLVGVDLNTASASLLQYISGLNSRMAENIVKYREAHGKFRNRTELNQVTSMGKVSFQQAAGFLRIPDGDNPLDNTSMHPESYVATRKLLKKFRLLPGQGPLKIAAADNHLGVAETLPSNIQRSAQPDVHITVVDPAVHGTAVLKGPESHDPAACVFEDIRAQRTSDPDLTVIEDIVVFLFIGNIQEDPR